MSFLVWNNQQDAEDSLNELNNLYGCPYVLENGYRMDRWDSNTKSDVSEEWGFYSPEIRPGKALGMLMKSLAPGYIANEKRPDNWVPDEEEEDKDKDEEDDD